MEYAIMSKFPLLSVSEDMKKWSGFIFTELGQTKLLALVVPEFPLAVNVHLDLNAHLNENLIHYWSSVLKEVSDVECESFLDYLERLASKITCNNVSNQKGSSGMLDRAPMSTLPNQKFFSTIIEDIEIIGVGNVTTLSKDFREILITHLDTSEREHQLKLSIPVNYPEAKVTISAELPLAKESIVWPLRIHEIHQMFLTYAEKCSTFWDDMYELDNQVKVVDPITPNCSHFHRRILLENSVIMHLIFDAIAPRCLPQISFSGPERAVEAFSAAIDNECKIWDETLTAIQNLKMILDCEFVRKESEEEDDGVDEQVLCTVCYVFNFEDEIPEITCDCGSVFHRQCLYDLFVSDVSNTGLRRCVDCPNCQMEIRVPSANQW